MKPSKSFTVLLLAITPAAASATVRYAKVGGATTGTCTSWGTGCTLTYAINTAQSGDDVWVKSGTHEPIALKHNVRIIGGFAGSETAASQSNPVSNVTIIDGGGASQCITGSGEGPGTVLRGFTITDCKITGTDFEGAAIHLEGSSAKVVNCIFEGNEADYFGAGAALTGGGAPEFINCTFRDNGTGSGSSAKPYGGGAVYVKESSPKFVNCLFHDNIAGDGGAILNNAGTPTLVNCTITKNSAELGNGGGIFDQYGQVIVQNSIIWDNSSLREGPDYFYSFRHPPTVTYSNIEGSMSGTGNINSDPQFVNPSTDNFKIPGTSPCKDVGNNAYLPADEVDLDWDANTTESIPKDLDNGNRKVQTTVDMGAYEGPFVQPPNEW